MIVDSLATRVNSWGDDRRTVQIWRRWDGRYRAVELHRIGESSRYREVRGETCATYEAAETRAAEWRGPEVPRG